MEEKGGGAYGAPDADWSKVVESGGRRFPQAPPPPSPHTKWRRRPRRQSKQHFEAIAKKSTTKQQMSKKITKMNEKIDPFHRRADGRFVE